MFIHTNRTSHFQTLFFIEFIQNISFFVRVDFNSNFWLQSIQFNIISYLNILIFLFLNSWVIEWVFNRQVDMFSVNKFSKSCSYLNFISFRHLKMRLLNKTIPNHFLSLKFLLNLISFILLFLFSVMLAFLVFNFVYKLLCFTFAIHLTITFWWSSDVACVDIWPSAIYLNFLWVSIWPFHIWCFWITVDWNSRLTLPFVIVILLLFAFGAHVLYLNIFYL